MARAHAARGVLDDLLVLLGGHLSQSGESVEVVVPALLRVAPHKPDQLYLAAVHGLWNEAIDHPLVIEWVTMGDLRICPSILAATGPERLLDRIEVERRSIGSRNAGTTSSGFVLMRRCSEIAVVDLPGAVAGDDHKQQAKVPNVRM